MPEDAWSEQAREAAARARHKSGDKVEIHNQSGIKSGTKGEVLGPESAHGYHEVAIAHAERGTVRVNIHKSNLVAAEQSPIQRAVSERQAKTIQRNMGALKRQLEKARARRLATEPKKDEAMAEDRKRTTVQRDPLGTRVATYETEEDDDTDDAIDDAWSEQAREAAANARKKGGPTKFQERLVSEHTAQAKRLGVKIDNLGMGMGERHIESTTFNHKTGEGGTLITSISKGGKVSHHHDAKTTEDHVPLEFEILGDAESSNIEMVDVIEMDDAAKVRFTSDGFLTASPRIARTGIQVYKGIECGRNDMDTVKVYRPQESVFHNDAMHSYAHRPVTLEHPGEAITADNWKKYAIGQTGDEVIRDGGSVRVPMVLMDADAIKAFKDGKNQLSVGYNCDLDWSPGKTADGESYDAVQRNIKANHLAVVAAARGGPSLVIGDDDSKGDNSMTTVTKNVVIDGIQVEMSDTAAQVVQRAMQYLKDQAENFKKKAKESEDESEDSLGKLNQATDSIKAKDAEIATLKQQLKDSEITPVKLDSLVKDRQSVVDKARGILGKALIVDQRTVDDIRKQVVESKLGAQANGWDNNQIRASFDTLTAGVKSDPIKDYSVAMSRPGFANADPRDAAYAAYDAEAAAAWRGGDSTTKQ